MGGAGKAHMKQFRNHQVSGDIFLSGRRDAELPFARHQEMTFYARVTGSTKLIKTKTHFTLLQFSPFARLLFHHKRKCDQNFSLTTNLTLVVAQSRNLGMEQKSQDVIHSSGHFRFISANLQIEMLANSSFFQAFLRLESWSTSRQLSYRALFCSYRYELSNQHLEVHIINLLTLEKTLAPDDCRAFYQN